MRVSTIFYFLLFTNEVFGAPVKTSTSLPLTGDDVIRAQDLLKNEQLTKDFAYFIKSLDVFPDHQNPKKVAEIDDRKTNKHFYIGPFFQASEERSSVGSQELSEQAIKIISEIYELTSSFDYELFKLNQIALEKNKKTTVLKKLRKNLETVTDDLYRETTENQISEIEEQLAKLNSDYDQLEKKATEGIDDIPTLLRKQVVGQIQLCYPF